MFFVSYTGDLRLTQYWWVRCYFLDVSWSIYFQRVWRYGANGWLDWAFDLDGGVQFLCCCMMRTCIDYYSGRREASCPDIELGNKCWLDWPLGWQILQGWDGIPKETIFPFSFPSILSRMGVPRIWFSRIGLPSLLKSSRNGNGLFPSHPTQPPHSIPTAS